MTITNGLQFRQVIDARKSINGSLRHPQLSPFDSPSKLGSGIL